MMVNKISESAQRAAEQCSRISCEHFGNTIHPGRFEAIVQAAIDVELAKARNDALEEAAKLIEERIPPLQIGPATQAMTRELPKLNTRIRALKKGSGE